MTGSTDPGTYFEAHQRATIEAAMARIIPTDDVPGAREAGTIDFLERYLSGLGYIYAKPDGSGFEVLEGDQAAAWMRRVEAARSKYEAGVIELDRLSQRLHGADFAATSDQQQDEVLRATETGGPGNQSGLNYGGPTEPALQQTNAESDLDFFPLLVTHTRQGFLSDPVYGGNRDQVGWKVLGFAGPTSLAEVHAGAYSTLDYFADRRTHPGQEADHDT